MPLRPNCRRNETKCALASDNDWRAAKERKKSSNCRRKKETFRVDRSSNCAGGGRNRVRAKSATAAKGDEKKGEGPLKAFPGSDFSRRSSL